MRFLIALLAMATATAAGLEVFRPTADRVGMAWPSSPPAVLEERASLSLDAPWQPFTGAVTLSGGLNVVEVNAAGRERYFRLRLLPAREPTRPVEFSPAPGEGGVAVTRETILRFNRPLLAHLTVGTDRFHATFGGRRLLSRTEVSADRRTVTLFFLENLPGSARLAVRFDGDGLLDADGEPLDADGDGRPGGVAAWSFDTANLGAVPGTAVFGRVWASERRDGTNVPLAGVTITVDGAEETLRAVTGPDGSFALNPSPAGRFFVHVDGRTAAGSQWPGGAYYPFVGKAWEALPGRTNNLAGGTGEIFLPLVAAGALQPVSATETTVVTFPPAVLAANPALAGVQLEVPPNALFADNGARGGRLGLAPVPPDRLPEPLPPGLNPPLVITIQSDGPMNFDQPVPIRFPNLPDPVTGQKLPPGAKSAIWGFNHDTGFWEIAGPATVSVDGSFVVSDPGTGVRQPGWWLASPGTPLGEPGGGPWGGGGSGDASGAGGMGGGGGGAGGNCPEAADQALDLGLDLADCAGSLLGLDQWINAGTELIRNFDRLLDTTDQMVNASAVDATTCDRFAALAAQMNAAGQLIADLAQPFVSEADPTRLADAVVDCGVSLASNAAGLACGANCRRGGTTGQRCEAFSQIRDAGLDLGELVDTNLRDPDSATELAFGVLETTGNALVASLNAYCNSGRRSAGLASPDPRLLELRRRALERHAAAVDAKAKAETLLRAGQEVRRRLAEWLGAGVEMVSRWMIEDRAWAGAYYRLSSGDDEFRGRVRAEGVFGLPVVAPNTPFLLEVYEPLRGVYGRAEFISDDNGFRTEVPAPLVVSLRDRSLYPDTDGDSLPDLVERVVGSRSDRPDTDGDGRSDTEELVAGENPLSPAAAAADGVTASLSVGGVAVDVAAAGAETVAVATERGAVMLLATGSPDAPRMVAWLTDGRGASRLAGGENLLLVSETAVGVRLYDVADPARPLLLWSQREPGQIGALVVRRDRVFYVAGENLVARDADSGAELFRVNVGGAEALLDLGSRVALAGGTEVRLFEVQPAGVVQRGTVAVPNPGFAPGEWGRRLAATDRLLALGGQTGFLTVTRQAGDALVLAGTPPAGLGAAAGLAFLDEQTLAATVRDPGAPEARLGIFDLRDPADVTRRVATYDTPGDARAVIWHRGRLFVADGPAGLTVVRHDTALPASGAPALELAGDFTSPAGQEALAPYTLRARLTGGHRGRVEYFLNGERLGRSPRFPHVWSGTAPARTGAGGSLLFTARAVTGGGVTVESAPLVVPLLADATPPRIVGLAPERGALAGIGTVRAVTAAFSEELDPATVRDDSLVVVAPGPDGLFGTADDVPQPGGGLERARRVRSLARVFPEPLPSGRYRATLAAGLADAEGNRLLPPLAWEFIVETPRQWISDADGLWGVRENWLDETLPRSGDSVLIDRPAADPTVTLRNNPFFPLTLKRVVSREPFQLDGALQVDDLAVFEGPLWLTNGARLLSTNRIEARGPVTWSGLGSPFLQAREFSSAGRAELRLQTGQMLYLQTPVGLPGEFRNEETGIFAMTSPGLQTLNGFGSVPHFVNRGVFRAEAPGGGTNRVSNLFLDNQGLIEVGSGTLELAFGLTNRGRLVVPDGTRLQVTGHRFVATRDASLTGGGDVGVSLPLFGGDFPTIQGIVDLGGTLQFMNGISPLLFTGERVSLNRLVVEQDPSAGILFRPLSLVIRSLHLRAGRVDLLSPTPVELQELETGSAGGGGGILLLETPVTVSGTARLASLLLAGSAPLRLAGEAALVGELNLRGLFVDDTPVLELATPLAREAGASVQIGPLGTLRILPGIEFDVTEGLGLRVGGTLRNEGVLRTADGLTGTADAASGGTVLNRGRLEAHSGLLRLPRVRQTEGRVQLAGGALTCLQGLELEGGELVGAGDLYADLANSGGTVSPGGDGTGTLAIGQEPASGWGGAFRQGGSGRLILDVASRDRHDRVTVEKNATLGGVLEVRLAEGFIPVEGDEFTLLTWQGSGVGAFDEVRLPALPGDRRFAVVQEAQALKVMVR